MSVEIVAESVISVYNFHNSKLMKLEGDTINNELFVPFNGPEIGEADEVLREALIMPFNQNIGGFSADVIVE